MIQKMFRATLMVAALVMIIQGENLYSQENSDTSSSGKGEKAAVTSGSSMTQALKESQPQIKWSISVSKIFWSIVMFLVALLVIKNLTRLLEAIAERWTNLRLTIKGIIPIFRIFGWTFVIYVIIAGIFAPPIQTLIAVTASAGIAVGFAAQDILKNIFGGIMILFDRPFQVGDKIKVGEHYGEVISIGLRTVRIVTPDDSVVSIPNSEIVNSSVSNANSGESYCQVVAELFLPPHINVSRVKQIAYRAAAVSRYVYLNKPIAVILKNEIHQGRSLMKLRLKAYVLDIRYEFPFMSEMTEIVMEELLGQGLVTAKDLAMLSAIQESN
ncbi:MAG: mechanosensitive ion channel [Calditrichia bacterium]